MKETSASILIPYESLIYLVLEEWLVVNQTMKRKWERAVASEKRSKWERVRFFQGASEKNCEWVVASEILNSPCFLFISQFTLKHATKAQSNDHFILLPDKTCCRLFYVHQVSYQLPRKLQSIMDTRGGAVLLTISHLWQVLPSVNWLGLCNLIRRLTCLAVTW